MKTIFYAVFILSLAGCAAGNNIKGIERELSTESFQLAKLQKKIDSLDVERAVKVSAGQLDQTTDSVTRVYIKKLKDSVNARLTIFNAIVSNKKGGLNKTQALTYLNSVKQSYNKELNNIIFLDDLFKASTFNRLNTAAFFAPGEYKLTDSAAGQASRIMQSIIMDAHKFSSKYNERKLKAMFIVLGYADEQEIGTGTDLYKELTADMSTKMPDRKQLNTELSNRRASSIKNILKEKYRSIFPAQENYLFSSSFIATGKGEALPDGNFKDYQPVDERRRIVLLYWSILPDLN